MKITPNKLIASWNALIETYQANDNPGFTGQADRLQMQLKNEVLFWNELSPEKKAAIRDEQMTVNFDKITALPAYYSNADVPDLQRFFAPELPEKQPAMAALINNNDEPNED